MAVPSPLKRVIEFPNKIIDIHMRNARLTVLATLNCLKYEIYILNLNITLKIKLIITYR